MSLNDLEKKTRAVFHDIHTGQIGNEGTLNRIRKLITTELLGVPANYFEDKVCADLACGSAVPGICNLLDLGAKYVHAMDVDESIIPMAEKTLGREAAFRGRWQVDIGSLAGLPYDDEFFDFVLCQGALHHVDDDQKALHEIFRVLKKGGMANVTAFGSGGLMTRIGMETMRDEYRNNGSFRALVDEDLTPDWIAQQINWLIDQIDDDGTEEFKKCVTLLECLRDLLDLDFILTLRDRMQAPKYKMYTEEELTGLLDDAGFSSWRRTSRKPAYGNIRKILAPLYDKYDTPLAALLYGSGGFNYVVTK